MFACVMSPFYGKINKYYNSKFNKLFVQENNPDFNTQFDKENNPHYDKQFIEENNPEYKQFVEENK